jgi:hypothetical protein
MINRSTHDFTYLLNKIEEIKILSRKALKGEILKYQKLGQK